LTLSRASIQQKRKRSDCDRLPTNRSQLPIPEVVASRIRVLYLLVPKLELVNNKIKALEQEDNQMHCNRKYFYHRIRIISKKNLYKNQVFQLLPSVNKKSF